MRVLVIDDDPEILEITRQALVAAGHEVVTAATGEAGLQAAERHAPDLAIVDLAMPGIDGFEVIRCLKRIDGPFLPVILFTAMDESANRVKGFAAGCDDFLGKPVDLHELRARVHSLLMRRSQDMELRRMNQRMAEAQKLKEDLAALVVHDLRNPLSALAGNIELLEEEITDPSAMVRESLADCRELAARALALLAGLLDVAQLEEGLLRVAPIDVAVSEFLPTAARSSSAYFKARKLSLVVEVSPVALHGTFDPDLIARVLENLVANAVRYASGGGRIRLAAWREPGHLLFSVGNDGPPVPAAERGRIFEKFYRIEERRAGARANRGMGLHFCRLAVEAHGGRISVEETADYPTTFYIRLPHQ